MAGIKSWAASSGVELSSEVAEKASYTYRGIISQIANHKSNPDRTPPKMWAHKFQTIWDKLIVNIRKPKLGTDRKDDANDDDDDDD
eukprot:2162687-Pyramimonas_sp.AAC.1